jgi:hypothetical protein
MLCILKVQVNFKIEICGYKNKVKFLKQFKKSYHILWKTTPTDLRSMGFIKMLGISQNHKFS